jgi:Ni,Fe-hydrogenase I large subunit
MPNLGSNYQFSAPTGGTQGPGSAAIAGGYNAAIGQLNNSLNLAGNTTSGQLNALQTQLHQNQGNVNQGLQNAGLGNSTILQTQQQAPLESYNQGVLNAQNQGALLQMGAYNNLASTLTGGGQAIANYYSPFAQQQAQTNVSQLNQNNLQNYSNLMNAQNQTFQPNSVVSSAQNAANAAQNNSSPMTPQQIAASGYMQQLNNTGQQPYSALGSTISGDGYNSTQTGQYT